MRRSMGASGFTILELILVLMLLAVVAALVIPEHFERSEVTLENASVLLARDLRSAQNHSTYLGEQVFVEILEEGDGYRVVDARGALIRNPRTDEPFERRYSIDGVFEGVHITAATLGRGGRLGFDRLGRASTSAVIELAFGEDHRVVEVQKGSGLLRIVGSTSGWVDRGN